MISSKIKKGKTLDLLVQFSKNTQFWPTLISRFYQTCKDERVKVSKTSGLKPEMIRFYITNQTILLNYEENVQFQQINEGRILKSSTSQIELKLTVIYMNDEQQRIPQFSQFNSSSNQVSRVLLLRETLSSLYDLNYEIESTLSPQESISYLCEISASLIDGKYEGEIQQYQQKKDLMIRKGNEGKLTACQATWRNMMFQVPGIGKDRVKNIVEDFSCYQAVIGDGDSKKSLKNLVVGRGVKGAKIGKAVADRIYKVFGSQKNNEKLY